MVSVKYDKTLALDSYEYDCAPVHWMLKECRSHTFSAK